MDNMLSQLEEYKDQIPEFVVKLYHILDKNQHPEYVRWTDDDEILIRYPKKFQDKVLPKYFRHSNMSSFIRQLNMYRFGKVSKILKEKHHMYFKNQHFKKGNMQFFQERRLELLKIKRNNKKSRCSEETLTPSPEKREEEVEHQDEVSIDAKIQNDEQQKEELELYKKRVVESVEKIKAIICRFGGNPQIESELKPIRVICDDLLGVKEDKIASFSSSLRSEGSNNFLRPSIRAMPELAQEMMFPSQSSFHYFSM